MTFRTALLATAAVFSCAYPVLAEDAPNYKETLTGDWGGTRTSLAEKGITTDITYKGDVMSNTSGGKKRDTYYLDNLDVVLGFDGEKLFGSKDTSAMIHFLNNNGAHPDATLVGSAQGIDNIEVPRATAKLYQAWLQQNFLDDKLSILAGLYDLNSEFYVTDSSMLFIHSTYGIGTDFSQAGTNGISIFPFTALATRVKVQPTPEFYVQAAVTDGVPGDPNNPKGTQVELNGGDGAMFVGEAGWLPGGEKPTGKLAVGAWTFTKQFPDPITGENKKSQGFYIIGEHKVYSEAGSDSKGLTVFGHLGFADKDVNQFDYAWSTGAVYTGLFPGRDEGQLGFGISGAHNSGTFKDASFTAGTPLDTAEYQMELTYSDNLTPWLAIQPDVQYIVNPSTDPAIDNAFVIGSRFTVKF